MTLEEKTRLRREIAIAVYACQGDKIGVAMVHVVTR
jgi:hypothetical protein